MTFISIFRVVVLSLSLLFSVVVLGLGAHWVEGSTVLLDAIFDFEIVALVAGCLSILILPVLLFVAATRKGAFTSRIVVEIPCLLVLCILWIVASALTASWSTLLYPYGCSGLLPSASSWCQQFLAIEGLSFVTWIILFIYTATLLTYTLVAQSRGNRVWNKGVNETTFFEGPNGNTGKADLFGGEVDSNPHYQTNGLQVPVASAPTTAFNPYAVSPSPVTPAGISSNTSSGYPQV